MLMGPDSLLSGVGAIDVGGRNQAIVAAANRMNEDLSRFHPR